jgi:hypothetical protein
MGNAVNYFDPLEGIKQVPYDAPIVQFVDKLIELKQKNGRHGYVATEGDWETLEFLYKGWKILYPTAAFDFENDMKKIKKATIKNGIAKDKGGGIIQHIATVPQELYKMIQIVFPNQTWDHKFVIGLVKHMPIFRSYDK